MLDYETCPDAPARTLVPTCHQDRPRRLPRQGPKNGKIYPSRSVFCGGRDVER